MAESTCSGKRKPTEVLQAKRDCYGMKKEAGGQHARHDKPLDYDPTGLEFSS